MLLHSSLIFYNRLTYWSAYLNPSWGMPCPDGLAIVSGKTNIRWISSYLIGDRANMKVEF
jgi:hypothetical protein